MRNVRHGQRQRALPFAVWTGRVPLLEAKMIHNSTIGGARMTAVTPATSRHKSGQTLHFEPTPRYWMDESHIRKGSRNGVGPPVADRLARHMHECNG